MIAVGALRARIELLRPVASGEGAPNWVSAGVVWAAPGDARTPAASATDCSPGGMRVTLAIRCRTDVRAGWRAVFGARTFDINGVTQEAAPDASMMLECEEARS